MNGGYTLPNQTQKQKDSIYSASGVEWLFVILFGWNLGFGVHITLPVKYYATPTPVYCPL